MITFIRHKALVRALCIVGLLGLVYQFFCLQMDMRHVLSSYITIAAEPDSILCYGDGDCFPAVQSSLPSDVEHAEQLCRNSSTSWQVADESPRIATVTAQFGEVLPHYEQALRTQAIMSKLHGADVHVLRGLLVDGLWNKPAYILSTLLNEMAKPEDERVEWLFWLDYDIVILDKCRSPVSFLPPLDRRDNVQMVTARDRHGLNNGIFLLRVSKWSVDLLNNVLAYRHYNPGVRLKYNDQTAMELVLEEPQFRHNVTWIPQWFFNSFPGRNKTFKPGENVRLKQFQTRRGDFLVHFAGVKEREVAMAPWLRFALTPEGEQFWLSGPRERDLDVEIEKFWEEDIN